MSEVCYWEFRDCVDSDKNGGKKWFMVSDCNRETIMTRTNKYHKLFKQTCVPHPQGTKLNVKCPYCEKELRFYDHRD